MKKSKNSKGKIRPTPAEVLEAEKAIKRSLEIEVGDDVEDQVVSADDGLEFVVDESNYSVKVVFSTEGVCKICGVTSHSTELHIVVIEKIKGVLNYLEEEEGLWDQIHGGVGCLVVDQETGSVRIIDDDTYVEFTVLDEDESKKIKGKAGDLRDSLGLIGDDAISFVIESILTLEKFPELLRITTEIEHILSYEKRKKVYFC